MNNTIEDLDVYHLLASIKEELSTGCLTESRIEQVDEVSQLLARDSLARLWLGDRKPPIWPVLSSIWAHLNESDDSSATRSTLLSITRFTRNVTPGCPANQASVFESESSIRKLIFQYTSFVMTEDPTSHPIIRFLVQALSNTVTSNEALICRIWEPYLTLPEEKNVLLRVLTHPDRRTIMAGLVFILNCTAGSKARMNLLISKGTRLCVALLDLLAKEVDVDETERGEDTFEIGWNIFRELFRLGLAPELFSFIAIEGEVVTPHQTTLLKIVDSYLIHPPDGELDGYAYVPVLASKFFELSDYARNSIRQSLGPESHSAHIAQEDLSDSPTLRQLDVLLPKVCQAIGLITECLCTLSLHSGKIDESTATRSKRHLINATSQGLALIESLIDLVRQLDLFLPRIIFGKASWSNARPIVHGDPKHVDVTGFNNVKRDLVRLLGILCYGERAVQNRVRVCEGLPVVMNLCVTDERNPYLREHALFTLRNLLHENVENQAVVEAIKPMGSWDVNGVLRDAEGVRK